MFNSLRSRGIGIRDAITAPPHPYRCAATADLDRPPSNWLRRIRSALLAIVIAAIGIGYWVWKEGAQERAISALPGVERTRLFERTLEDLRLCRAEGRRDGLREYCERQAMLALAFPECGAVCRSLALPWTGPTR